MRIVTKKVYKFAELSPEAKDKARYQYEADWGGANWDRGDDYVDSLKALAAHFGGKVKDYDLDWSGGPWSVSFDMPEVPACGACDKAKPCGQCAEESGGAKWIERKLAKLGSYNKRTLQGNGACKLTGMCYDESAIDGLRKAFMRDGVTDLPSLMDAAADTWMDDARKDYEYDFGDEGLTENFDANGYEFNEDGSRYQEGR